MPAGRSPQAPSILRAGPPDDRAMSAKEVDDYLAKVPQPGRSTLEKLRQTILTVIPAAEQGLSYQVPAFRLHGQVVAGFAAFKNHLSYLPFSGSVFPELREELAGYVTTSGALHFPIDKPLSKNLVKKLIDVRVGHVLQRQTKSTTPSSSAGTRRSRQPGRPR